MLAFLCLLALSFPSARAATFLFDASHAETAGNADWVIDEDGSNPQRIPTPAQENVTANTAETYWTGGISAWGIAMVKRGHRVETLPVSGRITFGDGTNAQDLSNYNVFAVIEPNRVFSMAEKSAIVRYVQAGGSLFLCADHINSDRDGDGWDSVAIWNDLFTNNGVQAAPFGVTINPDSISPNNETADSALDNPLTHGAAGTVTRFLYAAGASLTIDPSRNSTVRAAVWTSSSHTNSNVMVAYGKFGAGKFVAVGDSSPFDDGTGAAGNTLFNGWDDRNGDDARLITNAALWLALPPPPANDDFANSFTLSGSSTSASGTNANATKQTGEPNHGGSPGGKSVWWSWTAPASGEVAVSTDGSNFATLLGVYTGSSVSALTPVAASGGAGEQATSNFGFIATAGVTYRFAVDGVSGAFGNIQLSLVLTLPPNIANWNFDATPYSNPLAASSGNGTIDFGAWGGMVTNTSGVTGQALTLQGTAGNGTYIEIAFSMAGYSGLSVSFATRGTSTGYSSGTWSWSVNGGPFTVLPGVNTATTSTTFSNKTVDFTGVSSLNNASAVRLRYTLDGASGTQPNNRIDDLTLRATAVQTVSAAATIMNGYERENRPASVTFSSSLVAGAGGLPITFQLGGSATAPGLAGADYSLGGNSGPATISIPAGMTSVTLFLTPLTDNNPTEFNETVSVTVQPTAGYFVGIPGAASVTVHDDTPYNSTWASQFPGFTGANAAPDLDLERDGISNFGEFVFNGNPFVSDRSILPVSGTAIFPDPDDGDILKPYPTITFRRRTDAPSLLYVPESSMNLAIWNNEVLLVSVAPGPGPMLETVTYRGIHPLLGNGAVRPIFLRVHVLVDEL